MPLHQNYCFTLWLTFDEHTLLLKGINTSSKVINTSRKPKRLRMKTQHSVRTQFPMLRNVNVNCLCLDGSIYYPYILLTFYNQEYLSFENGIMIFKFPHNFLVGKLVDLFSPSAPLSLRLFVCLTLLLCMYLFILLQLLNFFHFSSFIFLLSSIVLVCLFYLPFI